MEGQQEFEIKDSNIVKLGFIRCCGRNTELRNLKPMYVNCECGNNTRYMTNMTEETFDAKCLNCKAPVAEVYNPIKGIYATIGFESKKHKKRRKG